MQCALNVVWHQAILMIQCTAKVIVYYAMLMMPCAVQIIWHQAILMMQCAVDVGWHQVIRACLFSKSSLAWLQEFWNSSICSCEIKRKTLFKSTLPTGSLTSPGPSGSGKQRALSNSHDIVCCQDQLATTGSNTYILFTWQITKPCDTIYLDICKFFTWQRHGIYV